MKNKKVTKYMKKSQKSNKKISVGKNPKRVRAAIAILAAALVGIVALTLSFAATPPPVINSSVAGNVLQAESGLLSGSTSVHEGEGSNGSYVQFDDPVLTDSEKADINSQIKNHYGCGLQNYSKLAKLTFKTPKAGNQTVGFRFKSGNATPNSSPTSPAPYGQPWPSANNYGHSDYPVLIFRDNMDCPDAVSLMWKYTANYTWLVGGPILQWNDCLGWPGTAGKPCQQGWDRSAANLGPYYNANGRNIKALGAIYNGVWQSNRETTYTIVAGGGLKLDAIGFGANDQDIFKNSFDGPSKPGQSFGYDAGINWSRNDVTNPVSNTPTDSSQAPSNSSQPASKSSPNSSANSSSGSTSQSNGGSAAGNSADVDNSTQDPADSVLNQSESGKAAGATAQAKKPSLIRRIFLNPLSRAWHILNPFD